MNDEIYGGLESSYNNPFTCIRVGVISKVYDFDTISQSTEWYSTVAVSWVDRAGSFGSDNATLSKIKLSYPHISSGWGFRYYPSVGDCVLCGFRAEGYPVILGYQAIGLYKKVTGQFDAFVFRPLSEGEYDWKSKSGCEVYMDRMGSLRLIVRDQTQTVDNPLNAKDKLVGDNPLVEVTLGKVYDNEGKTHGELFKTEVKSASGNSIRLKIEDYDTGNKIVIDAAGNMEISNSGNVTIALASGKKLSVTGDTAEIVGTESLALKSDVANLKSVFDSHTHLYSPGPSAPAPTAIPVAPAPAPIGTTKLKGS